MSDSIQAIERTEKSARYYKGTQVLTCNIQYPQIHSEQFPKAADAMNAYYLSWVQDFWKNCQEAYDIAVSDLHDAHENQYPFQTHDRIGLYEIVFNRDCTTSLITDRSEYNGGAHPITYRSSQTWALEKAQMVPLSFWFHEGVDAKEYALSQIIAQINRSAGDDSIYFDNGADLAKETFNPEQYYLNDQGIVLYFQQYDIAPYVSGFPEFTIPYTDEKVNGPSCRRPA